MKTIIVATGNPDKVNKIRHGLSGIKIKVVGLPKKVRSIEVVEDGNTPQENARKKAIAFAQNIDRVVLSSDSALYIDGLPDAEQPKTKVRRIGGREDRPTDEELIDYYSKVFKKLSGRVRGKFEDAICIATPEGKLYETSSPEWEQRFLISLKLMCLAPPAARS